MIVGFTGTRKGMTDAQAERVLTLLLDQHPREVNHGDCVGGDERFHRICQRLNISIVIHPPEDDKLRAFCEGASLVHDPLPYIERNRIIVCTSERMIATPKEQVEPKPGRGQGTWSTIRYARSLDVPVAVVWPDGSVGA